MVAPFARRMALDADFINRISIFLRRYNLDISWEELGQDCFKFRFDQVFADVELDLGRYKSQSEVVSRQHSPP